MIHESEWLYVLTLSNRYISLRSTVNAEPVKVEWSGTSRLNIYDTAPNTSTGLTLLGKRRQEGEA